MLAAHADEAWLSESSVDQCRSEADVQRQAIAKCCLYFSTKCVKMCICNKFHVSFHHFNEFRLQSWSFLYLNSFRMLRELILYAELIYLNILQICIIGSKISYFFIGLWLELKIVTWIISSNDWFHFSVFSAFRTLSLSAEHFRHENY